MSKKHLPFNFETPEDSPGFLLWQTTTIWQRQIKKCLDIHQLSHAQFVIMATLMWFEAHNYHTNQILIVHWTKLDKMTVSKSLKKLTLLGYTERIENTQDTRAKLVSLTDAGKRLINLLAPKIEKADELFFGALDLSTQKQLKDIFKQLINKNG